MIESISSIIERSVKKLRIEHRIKEGKVIAYWEQILDRDLTRYVRPDRIEGGILHLKVSNPVCMNELKLRQKSLVKKINDFLGEKLVSDLKVYLSDFREIKT